MSGGTVGTTITVTAVAGAEVFGWGANTYGQLGTGSTSSTPIYLPVQTQATGALAGKTIVEAAVGANSAYALDSNGVVYSWGLNSSGQLGNGTNASSDVPLSIANSGALAGKTIVSIAAGQSFAMALASDGTVITWGANSLGQLGIGSNSGSNVPVIVTALSSKTITAIAAGAQFGLAAASDGTVWAWGNGTAGELGNGASSSTNAPVQVSSTFGGATVVTLAAGGSHSLALDSNGTVWSWGNNGNGQLGNGSFTPAATDVPGQIAALSGKQIVAIAAGASHSIALGSDGTVWTWGNGMDGQLGNGSNSSSDSPASVSGFNAGTTITSIAAGEFQTTALGSDGTVYSWGQGSPGSLGNNSGSNSNVPVKVDVSPLDGSALANAQLVSLGSGVFGTSQLVIAIPSSLPPPVVTSPTTASGPYNSPFSYTITATNSPDLFGVPVGPLPPGLSVNSSTGLISGTPTQAGTYTVTIGAANAVGIGTETLTITISQLTPSLTWSTPADITYGTSLSATQLDAQSNVQGSFVYTPAAGAILPVGTGEALNAVFTPTDTVDYVSGGTVATTINVTAGSQSPVTISPVTDEITAGTSITFTASGGSGTGAYVWGGSSGATGATVSFPTPGTYTVTVYKAADSNYSVSNTATATITVDPISTTFAGSPVTFVYDGSSHGPTITATPSGATFSTGGVTTATAVGSYTATATANGIYTGSGSITWTITPGSQSPVTISPVTDTITAGTSVTFTASGGSGTGAVLFGAAPRVPRAPRFPSRRPAPTR